MRVRVHVRVRENDRLRVCVCVCVCVCVREARARLTKRKKIMPSKDGISTVSVRSTLTRIGSLVSILISSLIDGVLLSLLDDGAP